jgi:hypothetical protein
MVGDALVAGCRAHANGARLPSVHMQTTKLGDSSAGAAEARRVAYPLVRALMSASGPGGERQSDRECPCGDDEQKPTPANPCGAP